jgi:two-component system chemotaxis sensor kinase CheA
MFNEQKKLFVQEVTDLLLKVEKDLLLLENDSTNNDIIQDIFRAMHTVKGSAGVYNLEKTVLLAHNFESLFENIRKQELKVTNEIITLTLQANDTLLRLINADTETIIDDSEIEYLISKINSIKVQLTSKVRTSVNITNFKTFYIFFEPNLDIEERGIGIDGIINDFADFEYKTISKKTDFERRQKGKHEKFFEIIVSSTYTEDEIKAVFLFVPNEYEIIEIANFNIFEKTDFNEFYFSAVDIVPEKEQRIELLKDFCNIFKEQSQFEALPEEAKSDADVLIGAEEIEKDSKSETQQIEQIRVPASKLDELLSLVSELIINNSQLTKSALNKDYEKITILSENISKITNTIKENTLSLRLIPVENIIPPYKRLIRDLSLKFNKKIYFIADGVETLVDKNIIEKLFTPLSHIIRNAIDHGIELPEERIKKGKGETGIIRFIAFYSSTNVFVQIQDDGRGINPEIVKNTAIKMGLIKPTDELTKKEIYDLLFIQGFTTAKNLTEISGRGIGMDAIKKSIQDLRGDVEIDSEAELGTSVTIKLPLTLSIIESMHLTAGNLNFLIPISNINQCLKFNSEEVKEFEKNKILLNNELIPIINISKVFNLKHNEAQNNLIIVNHGQTKTGLLFNNIIGEYQAVIKNLGSIFREYDFFIGASILSDGSIGYILDTYKLINKLTTAK